MSHPSQKLHILLVEDTSALQQAVKHSLENYGCIVSVASSFIEVLKKFDSSFDGVLTDAGFPVSGNGFDVVRYIHQNFSESKAIIYMYSAFGTNYIKEKIGTLPVKGFFEKPFETNDIESFVKAVFENKRIVAL